jgi:hypothetical protein
VPRTNNGTFLFIRYHSVTITVCRFLINFAHVKHGGRIVEDGGRMVEDGGGRRNSTRNKPRFISPKLLAKQALNYVTRD